MTGFLMIVTTMAVSLVLGGIVFFATSVTPTVFRTLDGTHASHLLWALFPVYSAVMDAGRVCGDFAAE